MQKRELSPEYLSGFCQELALLLRAGITVDNAVDILSSDFRDSRGFLCSLLKRAEEGGNLYDSLKETGCVPDYMLDMVNLGERAGRLEPTLFALSDYYEQRGRLAASVKSAVIYPFVLIIMLAAVVGLLITRVLPIFADVFAQVGAQMSPFSMALLRLGKQVSSASVVIVWILATVAVIFLLVWLIYPLRIRVTALFRRHFGASGILRSVVTSQFASAMSTAISSGLSPEESVELAGTVISGINKTDRGLYRCRCMMKNGESVEKSLGVSGVFSVRESRLLALGVRTGVSEDVMSEIARRSEERAIDDIDSALARIEPTLVVVISLVVGAVLLSVMLPLLGIMSSIG